jgi:hypothetical protein
MIAAWLRTYIALGQAQGPIDFYGEDEKPIVVKLKELVRSLEESKNNLYGTWKTWAQSSLMQACTEGIPYAKYVTYQQERYKDLIQLIKKTNGQSKEVMWIIRHID